MNLKRIELIKIIIFAMGMGILFLLASCEKETDLISEKIGTPITFKSTAFLGENGGETTFSKGIIMPKTGKAAEDGLFISQFPLVEYKYNYDVTLDSVPTYVINETTLDTLSVSWEVFEVSSVISSIDKGVIWLPKDTQLSSELYIGIDPLYLESTDIEISIDIEGGYGGEEDGFLLALCTANGYCVSENGLNIPLSEGDYTATNEIPLFDESGFMTGTGSGFILNDFLIRFNSDNDLEQTKTFTLNVTTSNGSTLSKQFDIKFVTNDTYLDRRCWLFQQDECLNLFDE